MVEQAGRAARPSTLATLPASSQGMLMHASSKSRPANRAAARTPAPKAKHQKIVVGWREWVALPAFGLPAVKAKLDTGAKTSALHAFNMETLERNGRTWVKFDAHPLQGSDEIVVRCSAPLVDTRRVRNPGRSERRFVVETLVRLGEVEWPIELTLTNRDEMGFRALIGREALRGYWIVDPAASYRARKLASKQASELYAHLTHDEEE